MAIKKKKTSCPKCGKPVPGAFERTTHTVVSCHKCGSLHLLCRWCQHPHRRRSLPRFCENPDCGVLLNMTSS
jgi:hypothetical protein